ncbi:hypothetical protein K501DRAFT_291351 [Backusella circina FSU 941]|nr:hypothetical protein K501DRAFT_291351 [Backusella circina FSU 941]
MAPLQVIDAVFGRTAADSLREALNILGSCIFYKELILKYPDVRVTLAVRSTDSWYKSFKDTIHARHLNPKYEGEKMQSFRRMIKAIVLDRIVSDAEKFNKEEDVKQMFLGHIEQVKHHVISDRLYVMEFLGKYVPDIPYPCRNSTIEYQKINGLLSKQFR